MRRTCVHIHPMQSVAASVVQLVKRQWDTDAIIGAAQSGVLTLIMTLYVHRASANARLPTMAIAILDCERCSIAGKNLYEQTEYV